jgi:hypothetical protein
MESVRLREWHGSDLIVAPQLGLNASFLQERRAFSFGASTYFSAPLHPFFAISWKVRENPGHP